MEGWGGEEKRGEWRDGEEGKGGEESGKGRKNIKKEKKIPWSIA